MADEPKGRTQKQEKCPTREIILLRGPVVIAFANSLLFSFLIRSNKISDKKKNFLISTLLFVV